MQDATGSDSMNCFHRIQFPAWTFSTNAVISMKMQFFENTGL